MVRRSRQQRRIRPRRAIIKRTIRRKRTPRSSASSTGLGTVIARGAKTLISSIPGAGAFLAPIADFAFKSLGIATTLPTTATTAVDVRIVGLGAELEIPIGLLIGSSPQVISGNDQGIGSDHSFLTRFMTGKFLSITIKAVPSTQVQNRQGEWALSFTPYMSTGDSSLYVANVKGVPSYNSVASRPGAVFGSASRTLTTTYRVPMGNTYLQQFHTWGTAVGVVTVAYQDTLRDDPQEFKAAEVAPEIAVTGTVCMGSPLIQGYASFEAKANDLLKDKAASIFVDETTGGGYFLQDTGFKCQRGSGKCSMQGNFTKIRKPTLGLYVEGEEDDVYMTS